MDHSFAQIPQAEISRSSFDRSHGLKTTFNSGDLVPIFFDEVLPGDTFNLNCAAFIRMNNPLKVPMDSAYADTFFFFIPNRLTYTGWEALMGQQEPNTPPNPAAAPVPTVHFTGNIAAGSIYDYFGLRPGFTPPDDLINCLPFRGYIRVYNEWFRDENLIPSVTLDLSSGNPNDTDFMLLKRGKRHDYFTSCLPWPQKGAAVTVGMSGSAPVSFPTNFVPASVTNFWQDFGAGMTDLGLILSTAYVGAKSDLPTSTANAGVGSANNTTEFRGSAGPFPGDAYADLSAATAISINDLRLAFQLQRLLERDARGGTRYIEILKAHFQVTSPDFRLQRTEYLGGGSSAITHHPVPQTSQGGAGMNTPQGNLSAFSTGSINEHAFTHSFVEHGYVLGLISVRADLTYQQGVNRMWYKRTKFDFYWPVLANLGEQAVTGKEIYFDPTDGNNDTVFGYQERWAEYRYKPSLITGEFRSDFAQSLDVWHYSQDFTARPSLGPSFINEAPPFLRTLAVQTEPEFMADFWFNLHCTRPMPLYSVPGMVDHF